MVEPTPGPGSIDEETATEDRTTEVGYFESAFRDVDLNDEWETDQLAPLGDDEDEEADESPAPMAAADSQSAIDPSGIAPETGESSADREESPGDAFESDAEMFVKLLDELEASARAESAKLDSAQSNPVTPAPYARVNAPEPAAAPDARRVEEIASRLERIARSLRERGPAGPLADEGVDPLGAMVAGYLLGLSERPIEGEGREDS